MEEAFLPFIRTDRYGEGGWAPQPLWERLRLVVFAVVLLPLRLALALSCVVACYVTVRVATLIPNEIVVRRIVTFFGKLWSRACLFCLGFVHIRWVRVGQTATSRRAKRRSVAVVSNHMSWADILIQMARYFPAFVARDGTQNLPLIGLISRRMQCIYVDREKKSQQQQNNSSGTEQQQQQAAAASSRPATPDNGSTLNAAVAGAAAAGVADASGASGVSGAVKTRMLLTAQRPELELRPMLLFPEGTTTNGRCLLPFRTGAFLAGVPVLPTIIHYHTGATRISSSARLAAAAAVAAAAAAAAAAALSAGAAPAAAAAAAAAAGAAVAGLGAGSLSGGGGVSPCWESIDATRHLLLMMCQPFHFVTCYELPLYTPSPEEQADPRLYAANVRQYMLHHSEAVAAAAAAAARRGGSGSSRDSSSRESSSSSSSSTLMASPGVLEDKRRYQGWMRQRRADIEAGRNMLTAAVFDGSSSGRSNGNSSDGHAQQGAAKKGS